MKDFPNEMYIKWEPDGSEDDTGWYVADEDIKAHASLDEVTEVAVYKLVEVRSITSKVTFKSRKVKNAA